MDKYKKIRRIGEGSFGIAYLAKVKGSDKCVVIKEVNLAKLSRPEQEEARKEVLVLSQLKHCNIVTYLDSYEAMSVLSLVMDYCDGGDLSEKIKTQKGSFFAEEQILNWFVQLCLAVKYIHDRNILHRDIKTQNLFLTRHGLLKLGDFGIAKVLGNTGDLARTCIGTPYYLSPEICRGHLYDSKSDIWSMGCVLYELSALKHAFEASSMQELISKILRVVYPEISSRYSFDLRSIIDSMLQKNPSFRPSCDMLLKNGILRNRLKNLLSDLGLDTNSRQTTAAIVRYSAPVQDKSIFISGVRCLDAQDLKVAKRPSTCNPNDTQVGGEPIVYSDKENVFSSCDNHNHNNNHNLRKPLVRGYIDSGKKDSFLRSAAAKKRITIKPRTPLKRVHTPVNVGFKKFVAQNESMLKDKRGHMPPSPYHRPVNLRLRPAHNPSTHHLRCPGAMPENEVCSGAIPRSNIYSDQPVKYLPLEIHKDVSCSNNKNYNNNNNCNNNSSKNKNSKNPRHHSNVPLLRLPQEPIWSDYEPSPARLRDEERKRQDKEYMERFKEIGLENLREKFNKKMEHLEAVNAINPITGTPRPPDCESRKRKMALIKAQVDARVERIRRELEARRQEEFARESLRISREMTGRVSLLVHDFEEASPYESPSVIPPGGKCSSSSSLSTSEQEDQKDRVDCGNVRNRREAEVELKAHNDDYANLKKKRLAILKMINDQLETNNMASYDEKSSASCDLNSESNHKSKWNEIGHCTNLALLGLEESQIVSDGAQSDHQTRKRRHWSPMTETVILSLNSASISHSMESTDSKQSASEVESTLKTSLEGSGFPEDYPKNHDMAKPNSLRDDVANDNHDDTGISDSLVKLADDEEKEIGQDNKKEGGGGDYPEKVQEQLANQVVNKPSIQNKGMGNEDLPHSPDDDDGKIEKFIRNLKTFASQNIDIRRTRRSSETELGKTILRRTEEFHDLKWKSRFSLDSIPNLIDHLQDLNPQHSQLKTSIRQEAFVDTIIDMRKCLRVELIEIIAIPGEHNNALCDSENNIEDDDDDRSSINIHRDDSAIKNGMTSAKDGEPSEVNPEEWIKKKRMEILEIISRSIEAKQALSSMERNGNITGGDDDDYVDDCIQKVKDCAEVVMAKEDECDSFILSSSFQSFHDDDDDDDDDEEKGIDADGNIDDDSSREVDSDKDDDEDYEEQNDGEIIDGQLMPGNNIDNDNDDVSGDDDVNKDNCNSETVEEYSAISDDDLVEMEEVMRKSMASLLVTNPEDVTGDLMRKSMKMKKKKKKMKMRRVLGKPSVLTRMRRKRKTVVRVGSWSSTSIEDLQTMKSLLESYQDDDLN